MNALTAHNSNAGLSDNPGAFTLSSDNFRKIAEVMQADAGIHLTQAKTSLIQSRLSKRLRGLGMSSFDQYCQLISSPEGEEERRQMLTALTTNVTHFFREPHHFKHLAEEALPPLLDIAKKGDPVRLWSAGCSNGQEPYSIALTILSLMPDAGRYNIKILASDIDTNMIAQGKAGTYRDDILKNVPDHQRAKYFIPAADGKSGTASQALKDLITFKPLNLNAPSWPMRGKFQVIFCRNVVIYFNAETQDKVWSKFANYLTPGGHLYIGHSERMSGPAAARFKPAAITTYRMTA